MKVTYNQIIKRFEDYVASHDLLHRFTSGEVEVADLPLVVNYPSMHITPIGVSFGEGTANFDFDVIVYSQHRDSGDSDAWIKYHLSDMLQIMSDLIAEIKNGFTQFEKDKNFVISLPVNCVPFIEEGNNITEGWIMSLTIQTPYTANSCIAPVS